MINCPITPNLQNLLKSIQPKMIMILNAHDQFFFTGFDVCGAAVVFQSATAAARFDHLVFPVVVKQ